MSTLPAQYWMVEFTILDNPYRGFFAVSTLKLFSEDGEFLSDGIEPDVYVEGGFQPGEQPIGAIADGAPDTGFVLRWWNTLNSAHKATLTFDLGEPKAVDYIHAALTNAEPLTSGYSYINSTSVVLSVYASLDGITWNLLSVNSRPFRAYGTQYTISADSTSDKWPAPRRDLIGGAGGIYGIVSEDGIARPNRPVYLFERDTFHRIGYATTDENGGYSFNGLNTNREYLVMSVDPSGPPYKNAIVWDRIKPINAKGNLAPQSAFWARRARDPALGAVVAVTDYVDAAAFDYMNGGQLGGAPFQHLGNNYPGMDFDAVDAVGGSLKFLKSNRSELTRGRGLYARPAACVFSQKAEHDRAENYSALTFEYIFKSPELGEEPLIICWTGRANGQNLEFTYRDGNYQGYAAGPTIEVTDQVINIRFPLSGRNRAVPKATYPIVPGTVYHVAISYTQDEVIDCYIDGSLAGSTPIPAAGRLWGHGMYQYRGIKAFNDWDGYDSGALNAAISWLSTLQVGGTGVGLNTSQTALSVIPPGYGGSFAMAAIYGRAMTAGEIADLYDSFSNWETHAVPVTQSGYAGEVEADSPALYYRMNELSTDDTPPSITGHKGAVAQWEGVPGFGAQGFAAGNTAVDTTTGCLLITEAHVINSTFTIEVNIRQTLQAGRHCVFEARMHNSAAIASLDVTDGVLQLTVTDGAGTVAKIDHSYVIQEGTSYHIAVSYDPWQERKSKMYINGELVSEASTPLFPNVYQLATWLCVGASPSGTGPSIGSRFNGQIGEFALYNYVLPPERVAAHYAALNS